MYSLIDDHISLCEDSAATTKALRYYSGKGGEREARYLPWWLWGMGTAAARV